jgi:hypothetical protein
LPERIFHTKPCLPLDTGIMLKSGSI